jgi:hypothetical protein
MSPDKTSIGLSKDQTEDTTSMYQVNTPAQSKEYQLNLFKDIGIPLPEMQTAFIGHTTKTESTTEQQEQATH